MKKALLTIGSMVAVATPVVVAVSCGEPEDMTIVKTVNGIDFSIRNGKVVNIQIADGSQLHSAKMIATAVRDAVNSEDGISEGVKSAMPEQEVQWLPLIHFDIQPASYVMDSLNGFVASQDQSAWEQYLATPSTHQGSGQSTKTAVNITGENIINVDLGSDSITDLRTEWNKFRTLYYTPSSKFVVNITKADDSTSTMVFLMKADGNRSNSFMNDTDSYGSYDVTIGSASTPWSLNYATETWSFFTDFEKAWIAAINSETTDTSDDVTQFDWS